MSQDNFSYYLQSESGPQDVDEWVESIKWAKYSALKVLGILSTAAPCRPRSSLAILTLPPGCHSATLLPQAGYFRLDDINAKLKEQVQQAEDLVQQERARVAELERQCEQLRRTGGGGLGPEADGGAAQIEELTEQLRQTERERDQALRQAAHAGSTVSNDGCFEPTPSGML